MVDKWAGIEQEAIAEFTEDEAKREKQAQKTKHEKHREWHISSFHWSYRQASCPKTNSWHFSVTDMEEDTGVCKALRFHVIFEQSGWDLDGLL